MEGFYSTCSDVDKTITYKTKTVFVKTKTFDFFQDQDQHLKNGIRINSLSLIAIFLLQQKKNGQNK